jgi:hypothetical protein
MVASITSLPELVVPKREAKLIFAPVDSAANFVRVWIVGAPPGSGYRAQLDKSRERRLNVFESKSPTDHTWEVTFDVGGRYTFAVQEYARGQSGSQGYQGAPGTEPLETKLGDEETLTFDAGQRITMPVGTGADTASLLVWVWADNIRTTTLELHGEASPDIVTATPSSKMRAAMESTAVRAAVAALVDEVVATAIGNIDAIVADIVENHNGHTVLASGLHLTGDAVNLIPESYASAMAPKELPGFVNIALRAMRQHRLNIGDSGSGETGEIDSGEQHRPGSVFVADFAHVPIIDAVASLDQAYAALAELWRCHEGHYPFPSAWHGVPSGSVDPFGLDALPPLLEVHLQVFEVLASFSSPAVATQVPGAQLLIEQAGGVEG